MRVLKKGFTLIELIVVIAIIAILALILVVTVSGFIDEADQSRDIANAKSCYTEALIKWETYGTDTYDSDLILNSECEINVSGGTIMGNEFDGSEMPLSATYGDSTFSGS